MPGMVGFTTSVCREEKRRALLSDMQESITHFSSYVKSGLFLDSHISACHSDKSVALRGHEPFSERGVSVWLDGDLYEVKGPTKTIQPEPGNGTEVLCKLFLEDPTLSFLQNLNGIFAAVIYDTNNAKVHLITDRYGLRHLYWTLHNHGLVWASEVKAMLALPDFRPVIDRVSLEHFLKDGFVSDDRTWFEGVQLLDPGTVLTWDLRHNNLSAEKYWGWDSIQQLTGKIDELEIADELARRLVRATRLRCRPGERIGTLLSGGLDSRGILASMQEDGRPINCVTFGKIGCLDVCLARRAAQEKGAIHHYLEINAQNFFNGRTAGIWWIDGESNLFDLHMSAVLPLERKLFDIAFDGFWGDTIVGGRHIRPTGAQELDKLQNRGRRLVINGPRFLNNWLECRLPYCDNDIVDLAMSLPVEIRANSDLHKKMLLRNFTSFYDCIPWEHTWLTIGFPRVPAQGWLFRQKWIVKWFFMAFWRKIQAAYRSTSYVDYDSWLRLEPSRSFVQSVLTSKSALYPEYVPRDEVVFRWNRHLTGTDAARQILIYVTFEIWLQQVFERKYRPGTSTPGEVWKL